MLDTKSVGRIVVMDDNPFELSGHINELKTRKFEVLIVSTFDQFFEEISKKNRIDLFIIDVMIGEGVIQLGEQQIDTIGGTESGILLLKILRNNNVDLPVILFSTAWTGKVESKILDVERNDPNTLYLNKNKLPPEKLGVIVSELFENGKILKHRSWMKMMGNAFLLRPSLFGVGIDLKKLGRG